MGLRSLGINIQVLLIDRRREGPLTYYRMGPKVKSAIGNFLPDLVHIMYGGVMADRVTRLDGLPPSIVTFHGADLYGENLSGLFRKLVSHYGVLCSRSAAHRAQGVVVVAKFLIKSLGRDFDNRKLRVIPCGIDLNRFQPMDQQACQQHLGWRSGIFHVLFVSGIGSLHKRPELARAAVECLAAGGVAAEIHYLSNVPNTEVPLWINASSTLLLTSLDEASPTIVKETLACNVPVVSVDVGDVAERLERISGCHLAEANPANLALKLRLVWERRERLCCRERLTDLSNIAVAQQLKTFYDEIQSRSTHGRQHGTYQSKRHALTP
ncbi:MAG: glycosyltransferase [Formivibrio sp.]|nr:glycosyltransferase [Formivibrio sp.]